MNDKEEHTITENITPLQKNIAFRLLMWALVPILAAIGWQLGHAYSQTLDNEYVVDSKILVTNPHIEDDNENSRLSVAPVMTRCCWVRPPTRRNFTSVYPNAPA